MKLHKTSLDGVVLIELDVYADSRGSLIESYRRKNLKQPALIILLFRITIHIQFKVYCAGCIISSGILREN